MARQDDGADDSESGHGEVRRPTAVPRGGGASTATNGHWIHDEFGPRHYIGADAARDRPTVDPAEIIADIEAAMGRESKMDFSRVHISVVADVVILSGQTETVTACEKAGEIARAASTLQFSNRIKVADT